jgi:hypothetical protein
MMLVLLLLALLALLALLGLARQMRLHFLRRWLAALDSYADREIASARRWSSQTRRWPI